MSADSLVERLPRMYLSAVGGKLKVRRGYVHLLRGLCDHSSLTLGQAV